MVGRLVRDSPRRRAAARYIRKTARPCRQFPERPKTGLTVAGTAELCRVVVACGVHSAMSDKKSRPISESPDPAPEEASGAAFEPLEKSLRDAKRIRRTVNPPLRKPPAPPREPADDEGAGEGNS